MQIMDKTKMLEGLIRHYTKGNKAQFAKLLGVSAQTISAWIARNTFDAELIYAKCRYVDSSWLLTGEGAMLQETENNNAPTSKHTVEIAHQVPHGSSEGIPLIPLDAVAGFPAESGGGVRLEDCERYVIPEFENKGANFLIRVSGDSMVPLYYSGDLLACRKITDIRFFQWGTVYVLETEPGGTRQTRAGKRRSCRQHSMRVGKQQCSSPFPPPTRRHTQPEHHRRTRPPRLILTLHATRTRSTPQTVSRTHIHRYNRVVKQPKPR